MRLTVNSDSSLQDALGRVRQAYQQSRFVTVSIRTGKGRTLSQNSTQYAWYQQLALELRQETAVGWRRFCKLHFGVPILRAADDDYRESYDAIIKPLAYELKLRAMDHWPVTSMMTTKQLSDYLDEMAGHFRDNHGVLLERQDKDTQ